MDDLNTNNNEFPKEIKTENDNINPLLDIIANIQEKLESSNQNNTDTQNTYYGNVPPNFQNENQRILFK